MSKPKLIKIAEPQLGREEEHAVIEVLKSKNLSQGLKVAAFEHEFAKFIGTKYGVAVTNGTVALHMSLLALGIKEGDEVITTPFTFIATANAILYCGAKPIFVDIDKESFNIDPRLIEKKITKNTKAIMPVHLFGYPANMHEVKKIAKKHNLYIVEDAAQAHGATYYGKRVGAIGNIGCFSFYSTKNMTTGEGGMITTNSQLLADRIKLLRAHGMNKRYIHRTIGYNARMTDIQAAIGIEQLKKLSLFNAKRIKNAQLLSQRLKDVAGVTLPRIEKNYTHVFHQYSIMLSSKNKRDGLLRYLNKNKIEAGIYYPLPLHKQTIYSHSPSTNLSVSESVSEKIISLPIHPGLKKEEIIRVSELVCKYLSQ